MSSLPSIKTVIAHLACAILIGTGTPADAAPGESGEPGVVYHISDFEQASRALFQIGNQIKALPDIPVVIIGVGSGIRFMLDGVKDKNDAPFSSQIEKLMAEGAEFYVCQNTLDAYEINASELGFGVETVRSGIASITELQLRHHYAYIKP
jgi:intracellular sulfur oxidation DsrE/DsrF family protein